MKKIIGLGILFLLGIWSCLEPNTTSETTNSSNSEPQQLDTVATAPKKDVKSEDNSNKTKKIEGTYLDGNAQKGGAYLAIQEKGESKLKFQLNIYGGAPSHHSGYIEGEMIRQDSLAIYTTAESGDVCELTFLFSEKEVTIAQEGTELDCGFGSGIQANLMLRQTNSKAVFLDEYGAPIE
ncbi:MAG: hypothetical protein GY810_09245 [Aureispira sp.]|nr:hypothetical protein [Aureispira sp.]